MEKQQEPYFFQAARESGMTIKEYLNLPENYIITQDGKPLTWNGAPQKGTPCVYAGIESALEELKQWGGPIYNVSIIPEKDYIINTYGEITWNTLANDRGRMWQAMDDDNWETHDALQYLLKTYLPAGSDNVKFEWRFSELFANMLDTLDKEFCE